MEDIDEVAVHEEDVLFELERHQLDRAEEIRRALNERNELITALQDRLHAAHAALKKQKSHITKLTSELVKSEKSNLEAERRCTTALEELKRLKESERRAKKECEKLNNSLQQALATEVQVKGYLEEIKRLQSVESQLRRELKDLDDRRKTEILKERERFSTEIKIIEEQNKQAHRRYTEAERQLEQERQQRIQNDLTIKQAQVERVELEARIKFLEKEVAEAEKRLDCERKRAEEAENRLLTETRQTEEALKSSNEEKTIAESELTVLRRYYTELEEQNHALVREKEELQREYQERTETYTKELRRKNAEIFELENKLRGIVFTNERKLLRAEKEWEAKLQEVLKDVELRNTKSQSIINEHEGLVKKCERLEGQLNLVKCQRNHYLELIHIAKPLWTKSNHNASAETLSIARPRFSLKAVAILVFVAVGFQRHCVGSKKKLKSKSLSGELVDESKHQNESCSFAWSYDAIMRQSCTSFANLIAETMEAFESAFQRADVLPLLKERHSYIKQDLLAYKQRCKALTEILDRSQHKVEILEHQIKIMNDELQRYHECAKELDQTINSFSLDNQQVVSKLNNNVDLERSTRLARKRLQAAQNRILKLEQQVRSLEKERDDALVEAKNAREMARRIERYAESEIASLTRTLNSS